MDNLDLCAQCPVFYLHVPGGLHYDLLAQTPLTPACPLQEASWPSAVLAPRVCWAGQEPGLSRKSERTGQIHAVGLRPALKSSQSPAFRPLKPPGECSGECSRGLEPSLESPHPQELSAAGCDCQSASPAPWLVLWLCLAEGNRTPQRDIPQASGSLQQLLSDSALCSNFSQD